MSDFVALFDTSLNSTDFRYQLGLHIKENTNQKGGFKIIDPTVGSRNSNWAELKNIRYYSEVSFPEDAKIWKVGCWVCYCDKMILGELKDIWDHPDFNILHHYEANPSLLKMMPETLLSEKICVKIVKKADFYIRYIPHSLLTNKIIAMVFNKTKSIDFIPAEMITQEIATLAFDADPEAFNSIPKSLWTTEMEEEYEIRRREVG